MTSIIASNTVQYSSDSSVSTQATSPTKLKEIQVTSNYTGSWRIQFMLGDNYCDVCPCTNAYGRVYKTGAAYGIINGTNDGNATCYNPPFYYGDVYSQDFTGISIVSGDKIQLFAWQDSDPYTTTYVQNFRIMFDISAPPSPFNALFISGD